MENLETKLNETEIVVILDKSGSMESIGQSTVDGFNTFLKEQQTSQGKAFISLVQFNDQYKMDYKSIPVDAAPLLELHNTFDPYGGTALFDAIGKTIEELKTDRDVVVVIITDGQENASKIYKNEAIKKMIETQTKEGWKFLFLAANQDAITSGASIGIYGQNSMTYAATGAGATNIFRSSSSNLSGYRSMKAKNLNSRLYATTDEEKTVLDQELSRGIDTLSFSDEQREESIKK